MQDYSADSARLMARVWALLDENPDLQEPATQQRLVEPILLLLGWDVHGDEVEPEYAVDRGQRTEWVDYCLLPGKVPKVLLEVKKLRSDLPESNAKQVIGYAAIERVRWCVLSNGRKWYIFNAEWGKEPKDCLFREVEIRPQRDPRMDLKILSRESVVSGELDRESDKSKLNLRIDALVSGIIPALQDDLLRQARNRIMNELRSEFPDLTRERVTGYIAQRLGVTLSTAVTKGRDTSEGQPKPKVETRRSSSSITIEKVPLADLSSLPDDEVIICPSKPAGVDWMLRYYGWGYIRIRRQPKYFALYVTDSTRRVRYFARVDRIVEPSADDSPVKEVYSTDRTYKPGKKVLLFKPDSLSRLGEEIPLGENRYILQSPKYYTLSSLRKARTTDDLKRV